MDNTFALNGLDFSPEINMARYLQSIRKFPILEQDEEFELATRYKETKDEKIAYKLVTSHLRLVVKVVSKYRGYGLPLGEMISEGNIGLLYAVDKFEPSKGFRFSTYALWWILDTKIYSQFVVAGQNRHNGRAEKTLFQSAQNQEQA